jgi:hypothetical protein
LFYNIFMSFSYRPHVVCNIQPQLEEYLDWQAEFAEERRSWSDAMSPSLKTVRISKANEEAERKALALVRERLPDHRLHLATISIPAGERKGFQGWHFDQSGLVVGSSVLITEFVRGVYASRRGDESQEIFTRRIDAAIVTGYLEPVEGIEPGDIVLSAIDSKISALHRVTTETLGYDVTRALVTGGYRPHCPLVLS